MTLVCADDDNEDAQRRRRHGGKCLSPRPPLPLPLRYRETWLIIPTESLSLSRRHHRRGRHYAVIIISANGPPTCPLADSFPVSSLSLSLSALKVPPTTQQQRDARGSLFVSPSVSRGAIFRPACDLHARNFASEAKKQEREPADGAVSAVTDQRAIAAFSIHRIQSRARYPERLKLARRVEKKRRRH